MFNSHLSNEKQVKINGIIGETQIISHNVQQEFFWLHYNRKDEWFWKTTTKAYYCLQKYKRLKASYEISQGVLSWKLSILLKQSHKTYPFSVLMIDIFINPLLMLFVKIIDCKHIAFK